MSRPLLGCRVLVVEDEVMVSWLLEDMLAELGCNVVGPAARVQQAIAVIYAEEIDLAVLDVNLNGEKSYPVAEALKERGVPFIFSSGYGKDTMPDHFRAVPMLQKPYGQATLVAALGQLLSAEN